MCLVQAPRLYGPNTTSGVLALFTKDPFTYPGTTVTVDAGNQSVLRGSFRTAWAPTPKFGFKATLEGFRGTEWPFLAADTIGEQKPRDQDLRRYGGELRADFRPTPASEIIANYGRSGAGNAVEPTGLGPAQVKDWVYQTYQLRGRFKQTFAQVFLNTSDAGGTYPARRKFARRQTAPTSLTMRASSTNRRSSPLSCNRA